MIRTKRAWSTFAALALSSATALGGAIVGGGIAAAASPSPSVQNLTLTSSDPNVATDGAFDAYPGGVAQRAADWNFTLNNDFTKGEVIKIDVGNGSGPTPITHCVSSTDFVAFDVTPTVSVDGSPAVGSTFPDIHKTLTSQETTGSCAGIKDQLTLTIENGATGDTTQTGTFSVNISNIHYTLGTGTQANASGNVVGVAGTDTPPGATKPSNLDTSAAANAKIEDVAVSANSPTVGLMTGQTGPISNIVATEEHPGELAFGTTPPAGGEEEVCLQGDSWFSGPATVTAKNTMVSADGNSGTFASSVTIAPAGDGNCYDFWVQRTTATGAVLTLSGLHAGSYSAGPVLVDLTDVQAGQTASTPAFTAIGAGRIAGANADDTAIKSFDTTFCGGFCLDRTNDLATVVLASDGEANDALASNFLSSWYSTGTLLTPGNTVQTNLSNLLRNDGIGRIYITGGPDVVGTGVASQLAHTQAYFFRDGNPVPATDANGKPIDIQVIRIFGNDADQTAQNVDQYFGLFTNGEVRNTPGAYPVASGTPNGAYNDTNGRSSAVASQSCCGTVILASDSSFQDALTAGPLVYNDGLQVVLTPGNSLSRSASDTLTNLGPVQVLVVGGPAVISNLVITQIENHGASALRIAGTSYMDTSQQMARFDLNNVNQDGVANGQAADPFRVGSARGDNFADALTSAANLGGGGCFFWCEGGGLTPLLLTQNTGTTGAVIDSFLQQAGSPDGIGSDHNNVGFITVFGGPLAQTPALVQHEVNDLAKGAAS